MKNGLAFWGLFYLLGNNSIALGDERFHGGIDPSIVNQNAEVVSAFYIRTIGQDKPFPETPFRYLNGIRGSDIYRYHACIEAVSERIEFIPSDLNPQGLYVTADREKNRVLIEISTSDFDEPEKPHNVADKAWEFFEDSQIRCLFDTDTNVMIGIQGISRVMR